MGLLLAAKNSADLNCAIAGEIETIEETIVQEEIPIETDTPEEPLTNLFGEDEEELEKLRKEEERKKKEEEKKRKEEERKLKEEEAKKRKKKNGEEKPRIWEIFGQIFNEMDDTNV